MGKPSYTILVYQDTHLAAVPKPSLKKALYDVLRAAKLLVGKYEFKVHHISTAPIDDPTQNFRLQVSKTDNLARLELIIRLSLQSQDTYSGILLVPPKAVTADLVEKIQAAAMNLRKLPSSAPSIVLPAPVTPDAKAGVRVEVKTVTDVTEIPQLTDPTLVDLEVLGKRFVELIHHLQSKLLLPRSVLNKHGRVQIRREMAQAAYHLKDLDRLRAQHIAELTKHAAKQTT